MHRPPLRFFLLVSLGLALAASLPAQTPARGVQPVPTLEELRTALKLTDEQVAAIKPQLDGIAAAQANAATTQAKLATLNARLADDLGATLNDVQKAQLLQLLTPRRRGGGAPGSPPVVGTPAATTGPVPADQPAARTEANSLAAHTQFIAKRQQGRIDVYVEGDSIARRWGTSDEAYRDYLANWNKNFYGWNVADFGWGADLLQNILWRLDHGELDGVNPKVIVFLGGTINIGAVPGSDAKAAEIARGIKAVLTRFQQKAPDATVILTGIFPRNNNPALGAFIRKINAIVATYADGRKVRYLDVNDQLADAGGHLVDGMMNADGLHPTVKGYQVWADGLRPILTELLGPPAKVDHAPPPSADPGAKPAAPPGG